MDAAGKITVTPFLRKAGQTIATPKEPITGKNVEDVAERLLQFVLEAIEQKQLSPSKK